MQRRKIKRKEYRSLTSLRALGFAGVTLFHRFSHFFPGGYLAVIIFLVLAGFMTMRSADIKKSTNPLRDFVQKFIRIMGPVYFIMAIVMTLSLFFAREIFDDSIGSVIPIALNVENIARIVVNQDYFNQLGNFNIFNHLRYVSIYMQFIGLFIITNHSISDKADIFKINLYGIVTIISFVSMLYFAKDSTDISRIYYGIDTRISAFSLGAFLYLVSKYINIRPFKSERFLKVTIGILLILTIIPFFIIDGSSIDSYRFFFISYTLMIGLLIVALYRYEDRFMSPKSSLGLLTYIGSRSYHLYLWQYVIQVFALYFLSDLNNVLLVFLETLAIFIFSELSYQLLKNKRINFSILALSGVLLIGLFLTSKIIGNQKEKDIEKLRQEITANEADIKKRNEQAQAKAREKIDKNSLEENDPPTKKLDDDLEDNVVIDDDHKDSNIEDKEEITTQDFIEKAYDDFEFTDKELAYLYDLSVTGVGDSVIINADSYIRPYIPNFYLDGEVGRDMIGGPESLRNIKNNIGLGDIILISLGSNGSANPDDMDAIMEIADGRDVYFINTSHTQSYMDFVNDNIDQYCKTHDKAHLVDWRGYIKDRPDYLASDRTHPNIPGSDAFAKLIMRKILNVNKVKA